MGLFSSSSKSDKTNKPDKPRKPASLAGNALPTASSSSQNTGTLEAQTEYRPIFLFVWPSALFKIHWAVFIPADYIIDTPTASKLLVRDPVPRDLIEKFFESIPPPDRSLNSVSSGQSSNPKGGKVELSDCQWWITRCIRALVEQGILLPPQKGLNRGNNPLDIIAQAPRH